ncbi:sortase [Patescibacteria group bacterium]|nr:sortase [Patescibacteria group bacterium]
MEVLIHLAVRLVRAGMRSYTKKWSFLSLFGVIFFGNAFVLAQLGIVPEVPAASNSTVTLAASPLVAADQNGASTRAVSVELPTKISIPAIQLSAAIANPDTTNVEALDALLLSGAVRYPTSARLGETGNVVLFGHSSYLPIVGNQAYKTFNGIQKLVAGDIVTVYSPTTAYTYRVRTVAKESANDAAIPLSVAGRVLTLSTCDSFGAKTDRFVVVADFVESHSISG